MIFNQEEFGSRIRTLRKRMGYTQERLCSDLQIGIDHLKKIERGSRGCSLELLVKLSMVLGVSTDFLLTGKNFDNHLKERLENLQGILSELIQELP